VVHECLIIQFAKAPVLGAVKTRLQESSVIPAQAGQAKRRTAEGWPEEREHQDRVIQLLTAEQSLQLHKALVQHTLSVLVACEQATVELWGSDDHPWLHELAAQQGVPLAVQQGAELGERMQHALHDGLQRYKKVILVGSDCPGMDADYLTAAIAALDATPAVIGPAHDGGYVLIGTTTPDIPVFKGMPWGSDSVLQQTCERLTAQGVRYTRLAPKHDIDRPADLPHVPERFRPPMA
jgi:hypothetical protein